MCVCVGGGGGGGGGYYAAEGRRRESTRNARASYSTISCPIPELSTSDTLNECDLGSK